MKLYRCAVVLYGMGYLVPMLGWADETDPLEWRPPDSPPQFRNLLADTEYRRRAAPYLSRLPQAMKDASNQQPDHGLQLSGVMDFGPLGAKGVNTSDIIAKVDGKEVWGRWPIPRDEPAQLQIYYARRRKFGGIKLSTELDHLFSVYRRPELAYLRDKTRNVDYDRDVFVALTTAASAPDLAETAWHRATAAGFPRNRLCLASAGCLALAQGRSETALDFWNEADHFAGTEPLDPLLAFRVMIANYKLEKARDLATKYPEVFPGFSEGLALLIALHRDRPEKDRLLPPPAIRAKAMHRRDARGGLIGGNALAENRFLDRLIRREDFRVTPTSDRFSLVELASEQGLMNFDMRLDLTMAATDNRRAKFVKLARLLLIGSEKSDSSTEVESVVIGHVELEVPSGFSLTCFEPSTPIYFPDPLIVSDGTNQNSIRFLRVGGQLEVFVNERRILYQPIDPGVLLRGIHFQAVGTTVDVNRFALDELLPRL